MEQQRVIALGFFDGVHLGHGALLREAVRLAGQRGLKAAAISFDRHPGTLIPGRSVKLLSSCAEREALMRRLYGIDEVLTLHFDREVMRQPWEDFVRTTLAQRYHAAHLVCGHDYRFGAGGAGTPALLAQTARSLGIGFDCIPEIRLDGQTVSSTLIRRLLRDGEMRQAVRFLGHPHLLSGTVVRGRQLGRTLGIPTANMAVSESILLPRRGVYAAKARFDGQERLAVVNIGCRPTVHGETVTVEPWLLDFDGDLYGHELCLELYDFIRPEREFPSLDALKAEILRNAEQVRRTVK